MASRLPLGTLIELASTSLDESARDLGESNSRRETVKQQLDMLLDYRQDYLDKLQTAMQTGLAAADCHNYQRFINTLDNAIAQQKNLLLHAEQQLSACRERWQLAKRKLSSFETLQTREQRAQASIDARREQRNNDEHSARLFRHRGYAGAY